MSRPAILTALTVGSLLAVTLFLFLFLPQPTRPDGPWIHPEVRRIEAWSWEKQWASWRRRFTGETVGSFEHNPRRDVTKQNLAHLADALRRYRRDLGSIPFAGPTPPTSPEEWHLQSSACLATDAAHNVLVTSEPSPPFGYLGLSAEKYRSRWNGPYLEAPPEEAMIDAYGGLPLRVDVASGEIWVRGARLDGEFDPLASITDPLYEGDDHILRVQP